MEGGGGLEFESEGVWDLTQVLNPGVPMSQEGDRNFFGK